MTKGSEQITESWLEGVYVFSCCGFPTDVDLSEEGMAEIRPDSNQDSIPKED